MYWKLKVSGYGKIEKAEIEEAPLTLFVGDNNSGKSYLMSLLWGIRNFGVRALLEGHEEEESKEEQVLMDWLRRQMTEAWEKGSSVARAEEISSELQAVLDRGLRRNKDRLVRKIFNSQSVKIEELRIELKNLEGLFLRIMRKDRGDGRSFLSFEGDGEVGFAMPFSDEKLWEIKERLEGFMIDVIVSMTLGIVVGDMSNINCDIYFPASRTGFMLTKDIINRVGRNTAFNVEAEQEKVTPFSRPVNQFLDVLNDLTMEDYGSEKFQEVIAYMESDMTEGTVDMSGLPNREISYIPAGETKGMPLRTISAVVTELSPLVLLLKHKQSLKTLFYEEPEMCLHPQLQQKMAKVICRLVNRELLMIVTTHSDIMLQHINNMIRLSEREDQDEICLQFFYTGDDLLKKKQVKVYQFQSKPGGKTAVEELKCGENGFEIPTFNAALDKIMDEAYRIQG